MWCIEPRILCFPKHFTAVDGTLYGISQNQNRCIKWIETCISGYFIHIFVTNNNNLSIYEGFGAFIWQKVADSKLNVAEWTLDSKQKLWFFHSYQKLSCHAACTYSAQNFSISCSFFGYFEKPYVGVPPPPPGGLAPLLQEILDPPLTYITYQSIPFSIYGGLFNMNEHTIINGIWDILKND